MFLLQRIASLNGVFVVVEDEQSQLILYNAAVYGTSYTKYVYLYNVVIH